MLPDVLLEMTGQVVLVVRFRFAVCLKTVACHTQWLHQLLAVALAMPCDMVELKEPPCATERTFMVELF